MIFQRLHGRDAYDGTGIGLALCQKIVSYHGGTIWIDEGVTEGTTIRWTLPTDAAWSDQRVSPNAVPVEILLVEDDPGDVLITREAIDELEGREPPERREQRRGGAAVPAPRGAVRRRAPVPG